MRKPFVSFWSRILSGCLVLSSQFIFGFGGASNVQASRDMTITTSDHSGARLFVTAGLYDDADVAWAFDGQWIISPSPHSVDGQSRVSKLSGESATIVVTGSDFTLLYTQAPNKGELDIYVDDQKIAALDQSGSETVYKSTWKSPALSDGSHQLTFKHAAGGDVDIDAIEISGPVTNTQSLQAAGVVEPQSPKTGLVSAQGVGYYVSTAGSDTNPGTLARPWQTIQKAANTVKAGATVNVLAGNYPEHPVINRPGSASARIVFQAQGNVVTMGFTVQANYITIRGFEITNTPDQERGGWGIFVNGSYCLIENNYIHYATRGGIMLFTDANKYAQIRNCIVRNNRLYRNSQVGIMVNGINHTIANNEIWGTIQHHPNMAVQPGWVDADGITFHGSGHIFRHNYIHDILYTVPENVDPHIDCFQTFFSPPYQGPASNILFDRNRCDNARARSVELVGKGFMLQNATNITIRNNIINAYVGINADHGTNRLTILNNTFVSDLSLPTAYYPAGITLTNLTTVTIRNNLFFDLPGQIIYLINTKGLLTGRNLAYRSDGIQPWSTSTYSHVSDLWGVNPLLASQTDYHLRAGSPAIDKGMRMTIVPNDYDGNLRPKGAGYDIGAYEFH